MCLTKPNKEEKDTDQGGGWRGWQRGWQWEGDWVPIAQIALNRPDFREGGFIGLRSNKSLACLSPFVPEVQCRGGLVVLRVVLNLRIFVGKL